MKRIAAAIMAAGLLLAGCSAASPASSFSLSGSGTSGDSGGPPNSYLGTGSGWVNYVQWDSTGRGTFTDDALSGSPPDEQVSSNQTPITVTVNGSSVDFTGLTSQYGTLGGGTLIIQVLQSNGTLGNQTLTAAGEAAFNKAVAALQAQVTSDNNQAIRQQQVQASASADTQAEQNAQGALSAVSQGADFSSDLSKLSADVSQTGSDLAAEKNDAAAGPNADGGDCYNLTANVDYDAHSNVEYDAQEDLGYDLQNNLQPDIASERSNITALKNDLSSLSASGLPAPSGASAAIAAAKKAITNAIAAANADIGQVNSDVTQAYAIASSLATGSCSGDGPGSTPSPIPPIS